MKKHLHKLWLLVLLLPGWGRAQQSGDGLPPVTRTYAIQNANIVTQPGQMIEMGTVLIRDGLIEAVGKNVKIPVDAQVVDGDSMYVYAGFIEGLSHTGVPSPKQDDERPNVSDPGNPPNDVAGIQPERSVVDMLDPSDKSIGNMRKLGFTAAHVVPHGRMLPGRGSVVLLSGDSPDGMVLREGASLFSQYQGGRRVYPATQMAMLSKWRELYRQAENSLAYANAYERSPRGKTRPRQDRVVDAFHPVVQGDMPVFFVADGVKQVYRTLGLQKELGFPLVLAEVKEGWYVADEIKSRNIPILLSLELPEDKSEKDKPAADAEKEDKDADKKDDKAAKKKEKDPETMALEKRRDEELKKHEMQAATFAGKNIAFGFSTLEVKEKDIRDNLRRMINAGLTEDQALASLTTHPARMLGVSDIVGTIEAGKLANLVVSDQPYFAEKSNVRYVFVDGEKFEYEVKTKKKGDPNAVVDVVGDWSFVIDVPGQTTIGTFSFSGEPGNLSGTMTNEEGEVSDLKDVTLDGSTLIFSTKFSAGGQDIQLDFELVIDGDTLEGQVAAGQFGSFEVEGERTGSPD